MENLILVFGTGDILRKRVQIPEPAFKRVKTVFKRRGILVTNVFFGNDHPESIAIFVENSDKTLEEIAKLQY